MVGGGKSVVLVFKDTKTATVRAYGFGVRVRISVGPRGKHLPGMYMVHGWDLGK